MIGNEHFVASFDTLIGMLSVGRRDGTPFVTAGVACANTSLGKQSTASPGREHVVSVAEFRDRLGAGRRLTIDCRDPQRLLDLRVEIVLYDERPLVTIETRCTNVSASEVIVSSLEPIRALASEGGVLRVPGVTACLTDGQMFLVVGYLHSFVTGALLSIKGVLLANASIGPGTVASWWNTGLFSGYDREGVVLGFLDGGLGAVLVARTGEGEVSFVGESVL